MATISRIRLSKKKGGGRAILVRGRGPEGRVEKRFTAKRYDNFELEAQEYYEELKQFEKTGRGNDIVHLKPDILTFGEIADAYVEQYLIKRTRSGNNKSFIKALKFKWGSYQVYPNCQMKGEPFRDWIWEALDNPVKGPQGDVKYSISSIKKLILYAVRIFNWSIRKELFHGDNPLSNLRDDSLNKEFRRRTKKKELYLDSDEFWSFVNADFIPSYFLYPTIVLWCTGMRRGELCCITWDMIKDDIITFSADQTKESSEKTVIMESEAYEVIKKLRKRKGQYKHNAVFVNQLGNPLSVKAYSAWFLKFSNQYAKESGLKKFLKVTPHIFRDSYRTRKEQEGVDPAVVRAQMGHKNTKTSEHYNVVDLRRQKAIRGVCEIPDNLSEKLKQTLLEIFPSVIGLSDVQAFVRAVFLEWHKDNRDSLTP